LQSILTNHQIVAINVAGSSAAGNILSPPELKHILIACDIVLTLDDDKKKVIYIEIFFEKFLYFILGFREIPIFFKVSSLFLIIIANNIIDSFVC